MHEVEFERTGISGASPADCGLREFDYVTFQPIGQAYQSTPNYSVQPVTDHLDADVPMVPEIEVSVDAQSVLSGVGTVDFDRVLLDEPGPTRTFTVENIGNGNLTLSNLTLPGGYSLIEGLSPVIYCGASDTFTVRLNSSVTGTYSGNIQFDNNDNDENPFTISVTGTVYRLFEEESLLLGVGGQTDPVSAHREYDIMPLSPLGVFHDTNTDPRPNIGVNPTSIDFGAEPISPSSSAPMQVAIENNGIADLTFSAIGIINNTTGSFKFNGIPNLNSLAPDEIKIVSIVFDPATAGSASAHLRIISNDADQGTILVPLSGSGVFTGDLVWVDFSHAGTEDGTEPFPFNTLTEGLGVVTSGGTIRAKTGTTNWTGTINQHVILEASGGTVRMGATGTRPGTKESRNANESSWSIYE